MHASRSHSQESPFDSLITACMHIIITKGSSLPQQWTDHSHHLQNSNSFVLGSGPLRKLDGTMAAQPSRTVEPKIIYYPLNKVVDYAYRDGNKRIEWMMYVWLNPGTRWLITPIEMVTGI